jgi:hypothetical protein
MFFAQSESYLALLFFLYYLEIAIISVVSDFPLELFGGTWLVQLFVSTRFRDHAVPIIEISLSEVRHYRPTKIILDHFQLHTN